MWHINVTKPASITLGEWFSLEFILSWNKLLMSFPLKSFSLSVPLNVGGVFRTQQNISKGNFFAEIANGFQHLPFFANRPHHRCSTRFQKCLWLWLNPEVFVEICSRNLKVLIYNPKIKARCWSVTRFVFGKVLDQLIPVILFKINPIIDLSADSPGLGNFF